MALFGISNFWGKDKKTEDKYIEGVRCLQNGQIYEANTHWKYAAINGHISAKYNLTLLNGGGSITPYDIDFAAQCFKEAAIGGHPEAARFSEWIDKAEDTSFGTVALSIFAAKLQPESEPNHLLMILSCKLYSALCTLWKVTDAVIEYELDAASKSHYEYAHSFVERTGVQQNIYTDGFNRVEPGSAALAITDGINSLCLGLQESGHDENMIGMIRCTIVGYIISKSKYGDNAAPLLGFDKFFIYKNSIRNSSQSIASRSTKAPEALKTSIHIESIEAQESISVVVLALAKGLDCIYLNTYEPQIFEVENQGSASFRGPVYRINLNLNNGENFKVFYGIVTDDRSGINSSIGLNTLDEFCMLIINEIAIKISGLYDLHKFKNAPTHRTFYLEKFPMGYYITNNSGNDTYFLPFNKSKLISGDRKSILTRIQST